MSEQNERKHGPILSVFFLDLILAPAVSFWHLCALFVLLNSDGRANAEDSCRMPRCTRLLEALDRCWVSRNPTGCQGILPGAKESCRVPRNPAGCRGTLGTEKL